MSTQIAVPLGHGSFLWLTKCPGCLAFVESEDLRVHREKCLLSEPSRSTA